MWKGSRRLAWILETNEKPVEIEVELETAVNVDNIGPVILKDEIIAAMRDMKDGKAASVDGISVYLLKCLQQEGCAMIYTRVGNRQKNL
ncbi:hypothetical protein ILUMI_10841 [Ignelater luminosus]|uniref:Uncharacterized protein n=1 Tax=Ignelater luminosus TaxID=2038154 RepID=A0A8K0GB31_IGNLU|nr:hypothetical protein ILUMI_10841 [Ignelater luminosus]